MDRGSVRRYEFVGPKDTGDIAVRLSFEYQELHGLLQRWGDWCEGHSEDTGLPHQSSHLGIYSEQPAGHKILCPEMAKSVWNVHYQILKLPEDPRRSLYIWYAVNLKAGGGHWEAREKAEIMGWSLNALRIRVSRARKLLHRKLFGIPLRTRHKSANKALISTFVS